MAEMRAPTDVVQPCSADAILRLRVGKALLVLDICVLLIFSCIADHTTTFVKNSLKREAYPVTTRFILNHPKVIHLPLIAIVVASVLVFAGKIRDPRTILS